MTNSSLNVFLWLTFKKTPDYLVTLHPKHENRHLNKESGQEGMTQAVFCGHVHTIVHQFY